MAIRADRVGVREDQVDIHGRVTSPSFLNELLEDLPEWTDMPVWVNGTEELLPSNNSVPVTSPILADIAYPDIRRDNQYFTYRESPTSVDGLAKIKSIKGNTLVWNQQLHLLNSTYWVQNNASVVFADGAGTFTATGATFGCYVRSGYRFAKIGHKYLFAVNVVSSASGNVNFGFQNAVSQATVNANVKTRISAIATPTTENANIICYKTSASEGDTLVVSDYIAIDLTEMFGAGNEPATVEEFTSLFPLSYYSYNQGSLLSFNGNGIKTVGFNQWNGESENGKWIDDYSTGAISTASSNYNVTDFIHVIPNTRYYHTTTGSRRIMFYDSNKNPIPMMGWEYPDAAETIVSPSNAHYIRFTITNDFLNNFCFNISDTSKNGTYEPYTSSTSSLPVSTYFPTGMKSAGTVYDELTPTKAVTRIGVADLGTFTWTMYSVAQGNLFRSQNLNAIGYALQYDSTNLLCAKYSTVKSSLRTDRSISVGSNNCVDIIDSSFSDANAFKNAMNGVLLYYELATPVELPTMSFE